MTNRRRTGKGKGKGGMRGFFPLGFAQGQNDKGKGQGRAEERIPPLRCGMTNKRTGNGKGRGGMRGFFPFGFAQGQNDKGKGQGQRRKSGFLRCAAE